MIARVMLNVLVLVGIGSIPAFTATAKCKGNPKVVGACYTVHGRLSPGADTVTVRLWPVGTTRMLGVPAGPIPDDADAPITPKNLTFTPADCPIYGDFEVCPFTPERKGAMQMVCIESANHLVMKR